MLLNLKHDFDREYSKHEDKGRFRAVLNCLLSQGFAAIVGYRLCRWLVERRVPIVNIFIQKWIEMTCGISIPPTARIGKGLLIEHFGGIVINAQTEIGEFCTISHGVTIGNKVPEGKSPMIGNHVYICVGAKILGDITIGDHCVIGASAVVLKSFPDNSVVAGIPARVVRTKGNK